MLILAATTETQQRTIEFAGMPAGWLRLLGLLLVVALCYGVFWLYRREARGGTGHRLRVFLASLRCAVIVLLAAVWLNPVLATSTIRTITARVMVLVDTSVSMSIVDEGDTRPASAPAERLAGAAAENGPTRRDRVERLLAGDDARWLRRLAEKNELALYAYGEYTAQLALPAGAAASKPGPDSPGDSSRSNGDDVNGPAADSLFEEVEYEPGTDLGQALATALEDLGDAPPAAIVILSDGAVNTGMEPDELVAYARRNKVKLHTIGVGATREPANLRITEFAAPATVSVGDPFELRVEIAADGVEPQGVVLEIIASKANAAIVESGHSGDTSEQNAPGGTIIATRTIPVGEGAALEPQLIRISVEKPGEYIYQARLAPLSGEAVTADNTRVTPVLVLDDRFRVLLIASRPSYDYRYVTRLLERDKTVDLSCWLQSADTRAVRDGDTVIRELPRDPQDVFAYDAILLFDPNPRQLDASWAVTVRRFADEFGGGIFYQAGRHHATTFLRDAAMSDLVAILPVTPDPEAAVRLNEQGSFYSRSFPIDLPTETRGHPMLSLSDDPDTSRKLWAALPGIWWHLPVLREKPVAAVLMRHGDPAFRTRYGPAVLLALQPFGSGQTAFMGFDTTWRWRSVNEAAFNRFWIRVIRHLVQSRRRGGSKRGVITVERERVAIGESFKIEARVLDATFAPWHESSVELRIETPGGSQTTRTLRAVPGRDGWFSGHATLREAGLTVMRVALPNGVEKPEFLTRRIRVAAPDRELRELRQRVDLLKELSERTGGAYTPIEKAGNVPDRIDNASQVKVIRGADIELWDRTWVLLLLVTLLSVEWAVRRRNHLL